MIDQLAIYLCPNCGEILEDEKTRATVIDTVNDKVFPIEICTRCNLEVRPKLSETADGKKIPCFESVDHERWLFYAGYFNSDADRERLEDYL
jgi:predicted RNA-binding Zn-ribbon protein involved in translation (DUF1610 family)